MNSKSALRRSLRRFTVSMVVVLSNAGAVQAVETAPPRHSAALNYMMHCQGCHKADGLGQPGYIPALRDSVSRFLAIPEGRAYLGRIPGTSQSLLDDHDRAEVLNWVVREFDPKHVPASFTPYTEEELARYRRDPISQAGAERARVLNLIAAEGSGEDLEKVPPPQFALCGACHPTSDDGASAMGPNLRGVVGRRAGSLSGFSYSAAMRAAGIVWTREELDAYVTNPQLKVPGNMMPFSGLSNAADRDAVIDFLTHLQ